MNLILLVCIIGIPLCIIGLVVLIHDPIAMAISAEKSLESEASTEKDCFPLRLMTQNHENDWFPDKYIVLAKERMVELKC